jgi:hypothetical protein
MKLFVLDENGHVVFEFNAEEGLGYHIETSNVMQAKVIVMISEALRFLLKIRRV